MTAAVVVPRLGCLDAVGVSRILFEWLLRPTLQSATLVSFAFDADFRWAFSDKPAVFLARALQAAASNTDLTLVIADQPHRNPAKEARRRLVLGYLQQAGATILTHDTLHAKAFLFEEEGRCCWIVGSSNLTAGGLQKNAEVSLRGYHEDDYAAVRRNVQLLITASRPYSPPKGELDD